MLLYTIVFTSTILFGLFTCSKRKINRKAVSNISENTSEKKNIAQATTLSKQIYANKSACTTENNVKKEDSKEVQKKAKECIKCQQKYKDTQNNTKVKDEIKKNDSKYAKIKEKNMKDKVDNNEENENGLSNPIVTLITDEYPTEENKEQEETNKHENRKSHVEMNKSRKVDENDREIMEEKTAEDIEIENSNKKTMHEPTSLDLTRGETKI
uniref:Uncharacterized protein n=1 Tax=Heterorhabditis bacteriophora TaxID=37862 RepID=A0A1I7XMR3_HETBA